jgi:hypothetical protein
MKKILFILLSGIIAFGCEPNEELYEKLDKEKEPYHENIEYTLTSADYSSITNLIPEKDSVYRDYVESNGFYEGFPVKDIIPLFLGDKFPALNKGSQATINYNITPRYLEKFNDVSIDTLDDVTYSGTQPDDSIPGMLKNSLLPLAREYTLAGIYYDYEDSYGNIAREGSYYYLKNGTWTPLPEVYRLKEGDYLSMEGVSDDFIYPQNKVDKLLPVFLKEKFPYADEGDSKVIVYKYGYMNEDDQIVEEITAEQYLLDSNSWNAKVEQTSKFLHNGEKWVYDPTVRYKFKEEDYAAILNYVKNDQELSQFVDPEYGNTEYYYGASTYYVNFDTRLYVREDYQPGVFEGLSESNANQIIFRRIIEEAVIIALQAQFPDAEPVSDGVPLPFEITFDAYDGNDDQYVVKYKCTAAGNPPQFEFVEDIKGNLPYDPEEE